jgi:hypothetical protein
MRGFSAILLSALWAASASACPMPGLTQKLASADEHVFWSDFWQELDPAEASRELGHARSAFADLSTRLRDDDCLSHPEAKMLSRVVQHALETCSRIGQFTPIASR